MMSWSSRESKDDLKVVFREDYKNLDYVSAWFYKGVQYIENKNAKCICFYKFNMSRFTSSVTMETNFQF